jgi:hypothetical protein
LDVIKHFAAAQIVEILARHHAAITDKHHAVARMIAVSAPTTNSTPALASLRSIAPATWIARYALPTPVLASA